MIAGKLAQAGLKVVVLEAAGYFNEADFNQSELWAYQNLYWRGGPTPTADFNVALQAGTCLGGGTTINWTTSLRTPSWVREEWASEHGLEGVDGPTSTVTSTPSGSAARCNDECSDYNAPNQRLVDAAEALGWSFETAHAQRRSLRYDPASAGYIGFGDQSGSKQGTLKTYLQDAFDAGADILVRCRADRVLVEGGRAAGVEATYADPATGATAKVTVRAPQVIVAGGSLESPALLLRSDIGGPAAGKYLRLHPVAARRGPVRRGPARMVGPAAFRRDRRVRRPRRRLRLPARGRPVHHRRGGRVHPARLGARQHKALMSDYANTRLGRSHWYATTGTAR